MAESDSDVDFGVFKAETRFNSLMVHQRLAVSPRGSFAMELCKMMVCGPEVIQPKQGDTYQAFTNLTPEEAVRRAVSTTSMLFDELEEKGWIKKVPGIDVLLAVDQPEKTGF